MRIHTYGRCDLSLVIVTVAIYLERVDGLPIKSYRKKIISHLVLYNVTLPLISNCRDMTVSGKCLDQLELHSAGVLVVWNQESAILVL